MWSPKELFKRIKVNAFSFAFTFLLSLTISSFYPPVRDFVSWHAQYQLCQAAARGNTSRVNLLLIAGANPNGFNSNYQPLHFSVRYGQKETARMLLDAGADVNSTGMWRQTPLMEAVQSRDQEIAGLLLSRGASITVVDHHDGTVLWHAARMGDAPLVQLLMMHGGRLCKDAAIALIAAVENSDGETVRALLDGGVDPRGITGTHRVLPLTTVAAMNRKHEIVVMLKAAGAR